MLLPRASATTMHTRPLISANRQPEKRDAMRPPCEWLEGARARADMTTEDQLRQLPAGTHQGPMRRARRLFRAIGNRDGHGRHVEGRDGTNGISNGSAGGAAGRTGATNPRFTPELSVVIATYNRENLLRELIDDLEKQSLSLLGSKCSSSTTARQTRSSPCSWGSARRSLSGCSNRPTPVPPRRDIEASSKPEPTSS